VSGLTSLNRLTMLMERLRSAPTLHQPRCPPSRCSSYQVAAVLRLQSERQPIPDVPAVYFVRGGEAAVDAVAADAAKGLYDAMHLNFAPGLPPPQLERLAGKLVSAGAAHRVTKVCSNVPR
jgi:Sec1 family